MAQKKSEKPLSSAQKVGLGLGLTAAALAAAGGYFLYGSKQAVQNRKRVKSWTLKAKGEILEALEKSSKITEEEYKALVAAASGAYGSVQKATRGELKEFTDEMHQHWNKLQRSGAVKKITSVVRKAPAQKAPAKKVAAKKAPAQKAVAKKV